jgi:CRP-like cAMP-binding protein
MQSETRPTVLQPLVDKLEYRVKLSQEDRAAILALPFTVRTMERGQFIVRERERVSHSCLMLRGYSVRSKTTASGNRQILAVQMRGEMVDLQNSLLKVADHSVQMLTPGKVAMIPREDIVRLALERPAVAEAMWIDTLVDGSIFREWITNVGRRDARTRIAHLLCEFSVRLRVAGLGEDTRYELPMTQEQLADATGLTSVHVNRTIRALEEQGLIMRPNPRSISIGDWRKLAEVGDFDTGYLHLRDDEPALR